MSSSIFRALAKAVGQFIPVASNSFTFVLYSSLSSPYNSYDYAKNDRDNFKNVVKDIIQYLCANQNKIHKSELTKVMELLKQFIVS